jgi:UDP-N-acetylglucosamine--N-acetylmuramyl-(pentapeptide) pyrophosphoryl-undecaprenol N-acetylglucosamine transferase
VSGPVVLTGGGTGGHVFPVRAVAEALVAAGVATDDLVVVGARRGQEGELLADLGAELVLLPGRGLRRDAAPRALAANAVAALGLLTALVRGIGLVARRRPRVVVSFGGYAAFAAAVGAVVTARPLVLVDLDATPGLVHRILRPFAVAVTAAFPSDPPGREVVTGAPLRDAFRHLERDDASRIAARTRLGLAVDGEVVGVVTGSLGAGSVNRAVCALAERWRDRPGATLYQVTGRRDADEVLSQRQASGIPEAQWHVVEFERDVASLYVACDVAVTRAGAVTTAELCAAGLPALLVPLPGSPGDHQGHNARALEGAGAAVVLDDAAVSGATLDAQLDALLADVPRRTAMSAAARSAAHPDAAEAIAHVVLDRAR